jgi:hypothetical protein
MTHEEMPQILAESAARTRQHLDDDLIGALSVR